MRVTGVEGSRKVKRRTKDRLPDDLEIMTWWRKKEKAPYSQKKESRAPRGGNNDGGGSSVNRGKGKRKSPLDLEKRTKRRGENIYSGGDRENQGYGGVC